MKYAYQVMLTFHGRLITPIYFRSISVSVNILHCVCVCLNILNFVFMYYDYKIFRNMTLVCYPQIYCNEKHFFLLLRIIYITLYVLLRQFLWHVVELAISSLCLLW